MITNYPPGTMLSMWPLPLLRGCTPRPPQLRCCALGRFRPGAAAAAEGGPRGSPQGWRGTGPYCCCGGGGGRV